MSGLTDRLRQVAGQATPGPWIQHLDCVTLEHSAADNEVGNLWHRDDAAYVATFDPVLVEAMLDVIDAADNMFGEVERLFSPTGKCAGGEYWYPWQLADALARFREVSG